jgi:hypothetical protein
MRNRDSKVLVRLPAELHAALKLRARKERTTLNSFCVEALQRSLNWLQPGDEMLPQTVSLILQSPLRDLVQAVVLFGSRARGEAGAESDTDLLLCLSEGVALTRDLYAVWDHVAKKHPNEIGSGVSPHFSHLPDAPERAGSLWLEVALDGVVQWDRSLEVSRFLGAVRRYLLSGAVVRKTTYGIPYWVRRDAESTTR